MLQLVRRKAHAAHDERAFGVCDMVKAVGITALAIFALVITPSVAAPRLKKSVKATKPASRQPSLPAPVNVFPPSIPSTAAPLPPPLTLPLPRPSAPTLINPPGEPARPLTNPADWILDSDYPPESKRIGERGRVVVRMAIDRKGLPYRCWVVISSGFDRLDTTSCYIMQTRARFLPAHDLKGDPMEWTYQVGWVWTLRDEDIPAPQVRSVPPPRRPK
jgi:TonB family protein